MATFCCGRAGPPILTHTNPQVHKRAIQSTLSPMDEKGGVSKSDELPSKWDTQPMNQLGVLPHFLTDLAKSSPNCFLSLKWPSTKFAEAGLVARCPVPLRLLCHSNDSLGIEPGHPKPRNTQPCLVSGSPQPRINPPKKERQREKQGLSLQVVQATQPDSLSVPRFRSRLLRSDQRLVLQQTG